jgi:manganese transport protein
VPDSTRSLTDRAIVRGQKVLAGEGRGLGAFAPFLGPALIASVAYIDPGNFATNVQAGARYGYGLLWVVVLANLTAMLFQALSAKLGIVTGRNLAELCRAQFPRPVVFGMWIASEGAAMATDLAEFLGGAIGLALFFHIPLMAGMIVTGIATYAMLTLQRLGFRPIELLIGGLVCVIGTSYLVELWIAPPDWGAAFYHAVVPQIADKDALLLAVGIVGATVMPHAIYLHSGLTQARIPARDDRERARLIRFSHREVLFALGLAGAINLAMVAMAAASFHDGVHDGVAEIEQAYRTLIPLLGAGAAGVFLAALIASGLSSSAVGTMAGQVIMQGFVGFAIPLWVRRLVTMLPSFAVVAWGVNPTEALVLSQVVLSLALPLPMVALLLLVGRRRVMGDFASPPWVVALAGAATLAVLVLNALLVLEMLG